MDFPDPGSGVRDSQSRVPGRLLALLAISLFWAPAAGLFLSIAAVIANLRAGGWPRTTSLVAAGLSLAITLAFFAWGGR